MTIEDKLAEIFKAEGWHWNLKGGRRVIPTADDIQDALDEAARMLYDEPVGTQLEVGRLIVKKKRSGHDVYVYTGEYE